MKKKYQSEILQVIHEDMKGMHQLGIIGDARMREFDEMCLAAKTDAAESPDSRETKVEHADLVTA